MAALLAVLAWRWAEVAKRRHARIVGPSMATTLLGTRHFRKTCDDCGYPILCDADVPPYRHLAVCPNCGYGENEVPPGSALSGEPVRIELGAFARRPPRRWEIVAINSPDEERAFNVKRVTGLPGEHISIRDGDIDANGRLCRKSLPELARLAVSVHDDRFRPAKTAGLPARWRGEAADTKWRATDEGYACDAPQTMSDFDWLEYHHWHCMASQLPRTHEIPVLDNDSYNQGAARGFILQDVTDLYLSCRIEAHGAGSFALRIHDGREWLQVEIWPERGEAVLTRAENELTLVRFRGSQFKRGALVDFAYCDQQALLAVGGEQLLRHPLAESKERFAPVPKPVGIAAKGLTFAATELRILRDIHYLDPFNTGRPWTDDRQLAEGEYFVLGDNVPVSVDSRFWKSGSVRRQTLLGRVVRTTGILGR